MPYHEWCQTYRLRLRLKELEEKMLKAQLSGGKVSDLEFEAQALEAELDAYESEG